MKIHRYVFRLFFLAFLFPFSANPADAKTREQSLFPFSNARTPVTKNQFDRFERQLTDFFTNLADKTNAPSVSMSAQRPSQGDLFMIARYWNFFSPAFKALYLKSLEIDPELDRSYVSPGGHFEIYYTVTGKYAVTTADSYGYTASDWREKKPSANGVPDYIDEIAWALDSTWSMEIDGFGFVKPIVYTDATHGSNRYKVVVDLIDNINYGLTNPVPTGAASRPGSASILQIRNNWAGFKTDSIEFSSYPELAARVTCVHEFFHAIQYSMTWKNNERDTAYLDDFPVSWLEGTATLMENIGFDSVNDYLQYVKYFSENPFSTILNNSDSYRYTTVLLAMFLYERPLNAHAPSIAFIKKMFFNNYSKPLNFPDNLDSTAKSFDFTWPEVLGNFYTESYFMGDRSRPGFFVHDAPLFQAWTLYSDNLDNAYSIRKNVSAFGMETFSITKAQYPYDRLSMDFLGDTLIPTIAPTFWSMHCLLKKSDRSQDSTFSIPVSSRSQASVLVSNWAAFDTVLFIAANAGPGTKNAALGFLPCPVSLHKGDSSTIICRISRPLSTASAAQVSVKALSDLACSLSIVSASATSLQRVTAGRQRLVPVNVFYGIGFPLSWAVNSSMTLEVKERDSDCLPLQTVYGIGARALSVYRWDDASSSWITSVAIADTTGGVYSWRGAITSAGAYGLFGGLPIPLDSLRADSVVVFPNPVHVRGGAAVTINGVALLQLLLYTVTGALVYGAQTAVPSTHMQWNLTNSKGRSVGPGTYFAVIGYKDPVSKGMKMLKRKILVAP